MSGQRLMKIKDLLMGIWDELSFNVERDSGSTTGNVRYKDLDTQITKKPAEKTKILINKKSKD